MKLGKDERDMVAMQHTFLVEYADKPQEVIRSRLLSFGDPQGDTAIARTVALPAAIAVKMILDGKINLKGIYRPVVPEIYEPILTELEQYGIRVEETFGLPPGENMKVPN
jgi:saccharopine dehydrogenase-like NADP-dependent oxidoreductase